MKVIVLGSGVIGTAAAYYLMRDGHEVVVLERRAGSGLETSFANGGQLVASHGEPWAAPGAPWLLLKWLGRKHAPMVMRLRADPALWRWGMTFLRNCTSDRFAANTARNLRLGLHNRDRIAALRRDTGLEYDQAATGSLSFYREARAFDEAAHQAEFMTSLGCDIELADARRTIEIEPALAGLGNAVAGSLYAAGDELGDCHKFTDRLARHCAENGVAFRYGTTVEGFETEVDRVTAVATDQGRIAGDAFVFALGSWGPQLARRIGIRIPVYPVKGYAVTAPLADAAAAPRCGITDVANRVVFARLGQRLRVVGTAEFAGFDRTPDPARSERMARLGAQLMPRAADYAKAEPWCGLRPATPDSVPILGPTRYRNLWLDTGHGTLGWTHACASGAVVANLVAGRDPGIDLEGLTLDRF